MTAQEFAASLEALSGTARDGNMSGEEMIILLREAAATLQGLLDIARRLDPMVLRWGNERSPRNRRDHPTLDKPAHAVLLILQIPHRVSISS